MDRSRKLRNVASSSWTSIEVARETTGRFAMRFRMTVLDFRSILIFIALMHINVSSSHIPKKYPIEVYHMLQERTQFGIGRENRVSGSWGTWSSWSECSRTCGTGIQSQSRECVSTRKELRKRSLLTENDTKQNLRPLCIGTYKRYHTCNTQECPNFGTDFRTEQCAKYNGKNHMGHVYNWIPFLDANSCALNCRAVGEPFYATLEPSVIDGTPCDGPNLRGHNTGISMERTERWLCVAGQCKPVGCDGVIGSGATMDACGICGGRGQGCRSFEGIFMEPILPKGHYSITTIPKGAMSLNISELRYSSNYLALRDSNGSYILNGPWSYSPSGTYKAAGTTLTYQRGDSNRLECILATGPLNDSLRLEILFQQVNPGILYKYMLPIKGALNEGEKVGGKGGGGGGGGGGVVGERILIPPISEPISSNDQRGNEIPDGGSHRIINNPLTRTSTIRRTDFLPQSSQVGINYEHTRHSSQTKEMKRPPTTVMAGDQPNSKMKKKKRKKFVWKVIGYTPCSKECGGGIQKSNWKCFREGTEEEIAVNNKRCRYIEKPPNTPSVIRCNEHPCPARWRAGIWSECSVTCGLGKRTRKLECVQELNSKMTMHVASGACTNPPDLKTEELCSRPACPIMNTPELRHMQPLSVLVSPSTDKTYSQSNPRWNVGSWGPCSTTCGKGIRIRTVTCITSGEYCSLSDKPLPVEECYNAPCLINNNVIENNSESNSESNSERRAPWLYSNWSPTCSTECGIGIEKRRVACSEGSELFCDPKEKPETERQCFGNATNCENAKWFTGPWTSCSVSCGVGVQYRDVLCIMKRTRKNDGEYTLVEMKNCNSTKPRSEQVCEVTPCSAEWYTSDWSKCSATCGSGFQTRLVRCILEGVSSTDCKQFPRPMKIQQCNVEPCKNNITLLTKPPKKVLESTECVEQNPECDLAVKSGLCHRKYYKYSCCRCRD
ncbi:PREDICTED: ADAMTS-like protein 4 isoform X2 [Polistes dominula]|uniref:ADAMTS-like protein 4 isoform X2 n=1 Tax=Polistes dominula TaxID=743375 RepID=A0ABM1J0U8_POLDO|nr:PREDICTED: ADAMTS-like protein 4 isoform X2 [Polistes dominula]